MQANELVLVLMTSYPIRDFELDRVRLGGLKLKPRPVAVCSVTC